MKKEKRTAQVDLNHSLAGVQSLKKDLSTNSEQDTALALVELSLALMDSAIDILSQHLTTDRQMQHPSKLMPGGTPGKHLRHVIEMFQAFISPLRPRDHGSPTGPVEINYDEHLPSSHRYAAKSHAVCKEVLQSVRDDLKAWSARSEGSSGGLQAEMSRPVVLIAITPTRQEVASSVGRELWFCSLHAIHHFSMLRTIAVHELGLRLPVEFGTAPSTILFRNRKDSGKSAAQKGADPVKSRL